MPKESIIRNTYNLFLDIYLFYSYMFVTEFVLATVR